MATAKFFDGQIDNVQVVPGNWVPSGQGVVTNGSTTSWTITYSNGTVAEYMQLLHLQGWFEISPELWEEIRRYFIDMKQRSEVSITNSELSDTGRVTKIRVELIQKPQKVESVKIKVEQEF